VPAVRFALPAFSFCRSTVLRSFRYLPAFCTCTAVYLRFCSAFSGSDYCVLRFVLRSFWIYVSAVAPRSFYLPPPFRRLFLPFWLRRFVLRCVTAATDTVLVLVHYVLRSSAFWMPPLRPAFCSFRSTSGGSFGLVWSRSLVLLLHHFLRSAFCVLGSAWLIRSLFVGHRSLPPVLPFVFCLPLPFFPAPPPLVSCWFQPVLVPAFCRFFHRSCVLRSGSVHLHVCVLPHRSGYLTTVLRSFVLPSAVCTTVTVSTGLRSLFVHRSAFSFWCSWRLPLTSAVTVSWIVPFLPPFVTTVRFYRSTFPHRSFVLDACSVCHRSTVLRLFCVTVRLRFHRSLTVLVTTTVSSGPAFILVRSTFYRFYRSPPLVALRLPRSCSEFFVHSGLPAVLPLPPPPFVPLFWSFWSSHRSRFYRSTVLPGSAVLFVYVLFLPFVHRSTVLTVLHRSYVGCGIATPLRSTFGFCGRSTTVSCSGSDFVLRLHRFSVRSFTVFCHHLPLPFYLRSLLDTVHRSPFYLPFVRFCGYRYACIRAVPACTCSVVLHLRSATVRSRSFLGSDYLPVPVHHHRYVLAVLRFYRSCVAVLVPFWFACLCLRLEVHVSILPFCVTTCFCRSACCSAIPAFTAFWFCRFSAVR